MTMPNFLVIGAAKAGTTALYDYLRQHPQIYMSPVKEPFFFAFEGQHPAFSGPDEGANRAITSLKAYEALFRPRAGETALGEASALYLPVPDAPDGIRRHVPDAKLIAILRNPADRAYSSFLQLIRDDLEPCVDFAAALALEEPRIKDNWGFLWRYRQLGFYHAQLRRYFDRFSSDQLRVYLYEDLDRDPIPLLRDIFGFLDVDDSFTPDTSVRSNISGFHRNRLSEVALGPHSPARSILRRVVPLELRARMMNRLYAKILVRPPLEPQIREELRRTFREDTLKLQDLLQKDLSAWLS